MATWSRAIATNSHMVAKLRKGARVNAQRKPGRSRFRAVAKASEPSSEDVELGRKFKALRVARGWSSQDVADATVRVAAQDPGRYEAISRSNIANMEARGVPKKHRRTIAAAFGMSTELLSQYFTTDMAPEKALERPGGGNTIPPTSSQQPVLAPLWRTAPRWGDFCRAAMAIDSEITLEVLGELGDQPFYWGPVEAIDLGLVIDQARDIIRWRKRLPPRST